MSVSLCTVGRQDRSAHRRGGVADQECDQLQKLSPGYTITITITIAGAA